MSVTFAGAQQSSTESGEPQTTRYVYLGKHYPELPPLSLLEEILTDEGIQGARLSNQGNNFMGRLLGREFVLDEARVPERANVVAKAKEILDQGHRFIVADLEPQDLLAVADLPKARNAIIANIRASDDRLRQEQCRANVLHMIPSRVMRADALAQYLTWKRWSRWFLVTGKKPEDIAYARAVKRAAERFGAEIVAERSYQLETGARRVETGHQQIQTQMPMLTRGAPEHDVVFAADEMESFGLYLLFRTAEPRPVVGTHGLVATAWHRSFEQYGGMSVQNSFEEFAGRDMTERDYLAWLAIKMFAEAVVRTGSDDVARVRDYLLADEFKLAGYKGSGMNFRAWDQQLRQPTLISGPQALVSMAPLEGFLHPTYLTDTLGFDEAESECEFD
ncbi:MAG: ABC transporter substrate-binding protein [Gammaproteobacteria bacterium]